MERPLTLKSGLGLQSNYSVHHRSDILLEEQIETVKKNQLDLKKALSDLDVARTTEDIERLRNEVQEARDKTEKSMLVFQVLTKVNAELQFARNELEEALEKQEGDINEARKRVMWLEDRMGLLCGKARLRGQPYQKPKKSHRSPDRSAFHSRLGTATDSDSEGEGGYMPGPQRMGRNGSIAYKSDTTHRAGVISPSESGSDCPAYPQQARHGMADTPSSDGGSFVMPHQQFGAPGRGQGPGMGDSDSDSDSSGPPPALHAMHGFPPISGPIVSHKVVSESPHSHSTQSGSSPEPYGGTSLTKAQGGQKQVTRPHGDSPVSDSYQSAGSVSRSGSEYSGKGPAGTADPCPGPGGDQGYAVSQAFAVPQGCAVPQRETSEGSEAPESPHTEEADTSAGQVIDQKEAAPAVAMVHLSLPNETAGIEREKSEISVHSVASERSEVSERSESPYSEYSQNTQDPTFITEVPKEKSVTIMTPKQGRRGLRRVTFRDHVSVKELTALTNTSAGAGDQLEVDKSRDYWLSEHHRFEYSEHSEALLEINPLSYHNVGLAVPGTFLEKPSRSFEVLPWRSRRRGSEVNDIHKIALDKLAGRVHHLYDKFYEAALLSVRPTQTAETYRESTMLANIENAREGVRSVTPTDSRPGMVTAPPTTADGTSRPQTVAVEMKPIQYRPGLMVYHPKPIPPPEVLPLTRISKDKEYPRLSNQFVEEDDFLTHKPAVRIVDQRNLYKETQLKLYRDRPKKSEEGPSSMEKKFRMMLEQEKSMASRSTRSSRNTTPSSKRSSASVRAKGGAGNRTTMSRAFTKVQAITKITEIGAESEAGASTWSRLKPSSRGKEYSGLKWERVKSLVHVHLVSKRPEERQDAAKHLGLLRCGDAMVFFALKERLRIDDDSRTKYEAAKSLILLGCWDEDVLQVVLKYLVIGNTEIRQDLLLNMIDGKNVQYVNKKVATFPELVKVLSHFCCNPDPEDTIAFDAAILLGRLCVMDENAKQKLLRSLDQSSDTHVKAKALETLVKQLNCTSWDVVQHLLGLFQKSPVWKYRALAADLLIVLGKEHVCLSGEEERIYQILERKLWDDPNRDVRVSAAKALAALGMFAKACDRIGKRLEDMDEDIRAQAVISVGTLEMKNEKIVRLLLEMLELDTSEYVRLMIARTFTILKLTDKRVMRALRERDKVEGALARSIFRDITKRIKESIKSSGILGSTTPPYVPYRPEVYGVARVRTRGHSSLHSRSDRVRLLTLMDM
ncbi:uncharacterized protein LOC127865911 isoform X4 [Dreissena polymorpha]|uniref:uncharacterized protein LOC127865911 isoform X4 n=1 Tax=Dreissena polymorpha TaxID=45954 RepID=UPI00226495C8|nr:uncharacterized protein LOC127865911 isoform X4 [Dreissena polymorpha]